MWISREVNRKKWNRKNQTDENIAGGKNVIRHQTSAHGLYCCSESRLNLNSHCICLAHCQNPVLKEINQYFTSHISQSTTSDALWCCRSKSNKRQLSNCVMERQCRWPRHEDWGDFKFSCSKLGRQCAFKWCWPSFLGYLSDSMKCVEII